MLRYSCIVLLLAALLTLWSSQADAAPFFGLLSSLFGHSNGTIFETILQHKINTLQEVADLLAIAASSSG